MKARYLLLSAVLHGAVFCSPAKHQQPPVAIEVQVVYSKPKKLNLKPAKELPRLGSDEYRHTHRKLGDTMLSENYLERLHAHVDPTWIRFVNQTRIRATCDTTLNIDADANGTVLTVYTVYTDCPIKLAQVAKDAVRYSNLLPPPKQLLDKSGLLKLEWTFRLKPKDD